MTQKKSSIPRIAEANREYFARKLRRLVSLARRRVELINSGPRASLAPSPAAPVDPVVLIHSIFASRARFAERALHPPPPPRVLPTTLSLFRARTCRCMYCVERPGIKAARVWHPHAEEALNWSDQAEWLAGACSAECTRVSVRTRSERMMRVVVSRLGLCGSGGARGWSVVR